MFVAEPHAYRIRTAVCDQGVAGRQAIENRGRVLRYFVGREAEPAGNHGVDLKAGSWAAEGVLDSILHIDHAFDFSNRVADARAKLLEHGGVLSENLDLDRLWRIGQITDHVLQHLYEFDIERRFGGLDLRARIFNDIVDGAAAL